MSDRFLQGPVIPVVAALPAATGHSGRLLRTSSGLWWSDGAQWQQIGHVRLTESEYAALSPPVAGVLYIVTADP